MGKTDERAVIDAKGKGISIALSLRSRRKEGGRQREKGDSETLPIPKVCPLIKGRASFAGEAGRRHMVSYDDSARACVREGGRQKLCKKGTHFK